MIACHWGYAVSLESRATVVAGLRTTERPQGAPPPEQGSLRRQELRRPLCALLRPHALSIPTYVPNQIRYKVVTVRTRTVR